MQRSLRITPARAAFAALLALAATARADVVETRELSETIPVSSSEALVVIVKNVVGHIRITGHDAERVEMRATETVRGDLRADIERAREALQLRTETEPGRVAFRVRGDDADCNCRGRDWSGFTVEYDIEVRVPRGATLDVSTVNGDIDAVFSRAPAEASAFRTVNGDVDVTFPPDLSAELSLETMHGDVWTDFDVESLANAPEVTRDRGRLVARLGGSAFRIGAGGERHSFNTLNGDIYVRKANP